VEHGASDGAAFKFMRKAIGMKATDLAALLGVAAETISRWETGQREVDRTALAALAGLVVDELEGHTKVISILRALQNPRKPPKSIRIGASAGTKRAR
jgi:transcriptional regulator with XRE-family HTH domain